jgi:hypothetical protein
VLTFRVESLREEGYFAAYARGPSGSIVWYFPSTGGELPRVEPSPTRRILPRGARIGPEHIPGRYELHLFLLREKASKEALLAPARVGTIVIAHSVQALEVLP